MNLLQFKLYRLFRFVHRHLFGVKPSAFIQDYYHVHLGKNVLLSHGTHIYCRNHNLLDIQQLDDFKDVYIGDDCWIGANAVILPGVKLGRHTVVGAGAVVTKSFPEGGCVLAGVPAKVVKVFGC